jgi:uncharacterized membrane protein
MRTIILSDKERAKRLRDSIEDFKIMNISPYLIEQYESQLKEVSLRLEKDKEKGQAYKERIKAQETEIKLKQNIN